MSKTKKRILNIAKDLFNQKGFRNVTIRMIAEALGMSSGNLNYHYKKREDILEALYFEMVEVFDKRVEDLPETTFSIPQIYNDILSSMERMVDYRFFWTDMYHILQEHKSIQEHFNLVYEKRKAGFMFLCSEMVKSNHMLEPDFKEQYEQLAIDMINYGNTWLYASMLYNEQITEKSIKASAQTMLFKLYPYLKSSFKLDVLRLAEGN